MSSRPRNSVREIGYGLLLLGATLAVIGGLAWLRFDAYRAGLPGYDRVGSARFAAMEFPRVSEDDVVQLGWAHHANHQPSRSYVDFPEAKSPGTVRVGIFGCSDVFGDEAPKGAEFPSFTQRALERGGRGDVEVINFGVGAYGIHQSILLLRRVGMRYGLDVVMLNFHGFHRMRDESFQALGGDYGPLHARYVPGSDGPTLAPLYGATRREASQIYFGFAPHWRYLRWDARPPPLLQALVPEGRTPWGNPFYAGDPDRDQLESLYAALIDEVATEVPRLVVVCNDSDACRFAGEITHPDVLVLDVVSHRAARSTPSLYLAPQAHRGSLGNELMGEELAAFLLGRGQVRADWIELGERVRGNGSPGSDAVALEGGRAFIGETPVARLVVATPGAETWVHENASLGEGGVRALLDLSHGPEFRFLPLGMGTDEVPPPGAAVELVFTHAGKRVRSTLGHIEAAGPRVLRVAAATASASGPRLLGPLVDALGHTTIAAPEPVTGLELQIGGTTRLRARALDREGAAQRFAFEPLAGGFSKLRADTDGPLSATDLPRRGTLDLVLTDRAGGETRNPLVRYAIVERRLRSLPRVERAALPRPNTSSNASP